MQQYLGSVVPVTDNYYATLNSAVFTDGSFCYIPKGVRCPMELSTYFRINEKKTGQFERTLIIADEGSYVSYLEGCTAPMREENQLHAAVVELVALKDAEIKYSTVQNWYPGDKDGKGGIYNFVTKRGDCRGDNSKIQLDAGRDRLGDHLEVPELHPARRQLARRVLFDRHLQRLPAGRQRHQDAAPRQEHDLAGSSPRASRPGFSDNTYRGQVSSHAKATNARNFTQCDSLLIGDKCGAHTVPYIESRNASTVFEHEATTSKISDDQMFYCQQRGPQRRGSGGADRQRLRPRRAAAPADGVHGRDAEADLDLARRERRLTGRGHEWLRTSTGLRVGFPSGIRATRCRR